MVDVLSTTLTGGAEVTPSLHFAGDTGIPLSVLAHGRTDVAFPTVANELDLSFHSKLMVGADNQEGGVGAPSTPLGGVADRWIVYRKRLHLPTPEEPDYRAAYLGLPVLTLEGKFKSPGIKIYAGISPQEDYVYPYNFNGAEFSAGGDPWTASTLRYNLFDNTSAANLYTAQIGWLAGIEFAPPTVSGLRLVFQTAADGGFEPNGSWASTAQVGYERSYPLGSLAALTSLTFFATTLSPVESFDAEAVHHLPKQGVGFFVSQKVGDLTLGIGFGRNGGKTESLDVLSDETTVTATNIGYQLSFLDKRLLVAGAYSYVSAENDHVDLSGHTASKSAEHGFEPVTVHYAVAPGFVASAGGIYVAAADADDVRLLYLALSWNGLKSL